MREANAIAAAAKQGCLRTGADLFVTVNPCDVCARLIIAAGISPRVLFNCSREKKDAGDMFRRTSKYQFRQARSDYIAVDEATDEKLREIMRYASA